MYLYWVSITYSAGTSIAKNATAQEKQTKHFLTQTSTTATTTQQPLKNQ